MLAVAALMACAAILPLAPGSLASAAEPVRVPSVAPAADTPAATSPPAGEPATVVAAGDPRSEGEGPGLVGSPIAILLGVVALGVVTSAATVLLVRLRGDR